MSPALITAISTGAVSIIGAVTALVRAFRTQTQLTAHISDPKAHQ